MVAWIPGISIGLRPPPADFPFRNHFDNARESTMIILSVDADEVALEVVRVVAAIYIDSEDTVGM